MRKRLAIILILILTTTALARAQRPSLAADDPDEPVVVEPSDGQWSQMMIRGTWIPLDLEPVEGPPKFDDLDQRALPATDTCGNAPPLDLAQPGGDGGQTLVNNYSESPLDPPLACAWGDPSNPNGWRTAWYRFTAPTGGRVVIETVPNADYRDNYDTVLAVYTGSCANLSVRACSDDASGFLSRVAVAVQAGQTYYVEVADWQLGVNGEAKLNVLAYLTANERFWEQATTTPIARSRHAAEVINNELYLIGGQTVVGNTPIRTPSVQKYNPATQQWTSLSPMPGPDGLGYSNVDPATVDGVIYFPSGWVGDNDSYDGTHWAYITETDTWTTTIEAPWATPTAPVGYSANVAAANVDGYYLIGGLVGEPFSLDAVPQEAVFRFRPAPFPGAGDQWFTTTPPLTIARYLHTGVQLQSPQDWVCVVGGLTFGNQFTSNGECYTTAGQWRLIADTNIKRFGAQSIIGPDGRWYVIGGWDATFQVVEEIEVFNPPNPGNPGDQGSWTILDGRYNVAAPVRTWTPGGTIGDYMYITGGETQDNLVVPLVERIYLPPQFDAWKGFFPVVLRGAFTDDDTFATARPLLLNQWEYDDFVAPGDLFAMFTIDLAQGGNYAVQLQNIPAAGDYDLFVYTPNKFPLGSSANVGSNDERVDLSLNAGRYYVFVIRSFPTGNPPDGQFRVRVTQ